MSVVKFDLRKSLHDIYSPPVGDVELITPPRMKYIMVDGEGDPQGDSFQQAMGVLFGLAYTLKFRSRKQMKKDYNVMTPEGLWWFRGGGFDPSRRRDWLWTLMVVVPDFITDSMFNEAKLELREKKNPPGLDKARLESFDEGLCAQTMHLGPYSAESESIARLETFAKAHGYRMVGKHHEIYLGDPRRPRPSKLRTILRHPLARTSRLPMMERLANDSQSDETSDCPIVGEPDLVCGVRGVPGDGKAYQRAAGSCRP